MSTSPFSDSHATPAEYLNPVPTKGVQIELTENPSYTVTKQPVQKTTEEFYDYINPEGQEANSNELEAESGSSIPPPPPPPASVRRERSDCVACVVVSVLTVMMMSMLALVVAVATLVITTQQNGELQQQIAGLMRRDTELTQQNAEMQEERETSQMLVDSLSNRIQVLEQLLLTEDTTTPPTNQPLYTTPVTTPTPDPLPFGEEVTLSALNLFQDCNTSIEDRCTIDPGAPATGNDFLSCSTSIEGVTINRPGEYVLNVQCLIVEETVESNPLIATLDVDANLAICRCYVPTLNIVSQVGNPVTCGLQITRCTIPTNITARILPLRLG